VVSEECRRDVTLGKRAEAAQSRAGEGRARFADSCKGQKSSTRESQRGNAATSIKRMRRRMGAHQRVAHRVRAGERAVVQRYAAAPRPQERRCRITAATPAKAHRVVACASNPSGTSPAKPSDAHRALVANLRCRGKLICAPGKSVVPCPG